MADRVVYSKRVADSLAVDVTVPSDKLGSAFPTAGSVVVSPSGLTAGTVSPLAAGVRFTATGGTTGINYTLTLTITLSDARSVTELVQVSVLDETLNTDRSIGISGYPPSIVFTDRQSAEDLLSEMNVQLRLDDDESAGIGTRERSLTVKGAYVATGWVKRHCTTYDASDLAQSWSVWNWATIYLARWLCLRRGNPIPPGLYEMYAEALADLKAVQAGTMFIEDVPAKLDPEPSWSNVRIDHSRPVSPMVIERKTSDRSHANFKRRRDWFGEYVSDPEM